jgi:hypothetical protein
VLGPLAASGVWLPALVWAAAAAVLPWLVRGRSLGLDAARVAIWSVATLFAVSAVLGAARTVPHPGPRGAAAGVVAAALAALAMPAGAVMRERHRARGLRARLP